MENPVFSMFILSLSVISSTLRLWKTNAIFYAVRFHNNVSSKLSYELLAINQTHWFFFLLFIFLQDLEFHGVMRFYFQDKAAGNFATKCIRVSSTATTQDVIETLAEKFRPDMRMLSSPKYSLYEVHVSGG